MPTIMETPRKKRTTLDQKAFMDHVPIVHGSQIQSMIRIVGAREHNLKNLSVNVPRGKFVVITGVSGSAKARWL